MAKQKILIVDDDNVIAELIQLYLTKECFDTKIVNDGDLAINEFESYQPDLILLDLMLPGMDGYQICREIRAKSDTPIITVSAKGEVFDKVLSFELGADDYIEKPFEPKELIARIKAVLRRCTPQKKEEPVLNQSNNIKLVSFPDLEINLTNYTVTYKGEYLEMPPKEIELLYFLASNPNQVFTRDQLLDNMESFHRMGRRIQIRS